jgi:hypothetical protein
MFLFHEAGDHSAPVSPHYRRFTITLRHTTLGRTPMEELSTRRRDLYLTTHTLTRDRHPCPRRDPNQQSQQASGHILNPSIARPLDSVRICDTYWFSNSVMVTRTHLNVTLYVHCFVCQIRFTTQGYLQNAVHAIHNKHGLRQSSLCTLGYV